MSYNPTTELEAFINRARIAYYNGMPLIPDELYDVLIVMILNILYI